jgi:hypothetical protein
MPIEVGPAAGDEHAVPTKSTCRPYGIRALDRCALISMKDTIGDRDHHRFRRADEVDPRMRMFPQGVSESLTDVERRAVHRGSDNGRGQRGARIRGVAVACWIAPHAD